MTWKQQLGAQIRAYRLAIGLTQEELGKKAQISRPMLGRYERGGEAPSVEILSRICKALGTREFRFDEFRIVLDYSHAADPPADQLFLPYDIDRIFKNATVKIRPSRGSISLTVLSA